jgi:hypothetical protein
MPCRALRTHRHSESQKLRVLESRGRLTILAMRGIIDNSQLYPRRPAAQIAPSAQDRAIRRV